MVYLTTKRSFLIIARLSMSKQTSKRVTHELQFNVAQLLKEVTGGYRDYDINTQFEKSLDEDLITVAPLVGQVKLLRTGPNILVTGALESVIQKSCGRCLNTFAAPITISLEEEFYPTTDIHTGATVSEPPDADEANRIDEHHILDLTEVIRQELIVTSDSILYCKPDCRGLCPHCGRDRNIEPCDCQDTQIDSRWADLKALQIDDN